MQPDTNRPAPARAQDFDVHGLARFRIERGHRASEASSRQLWAHYEALASTRSGEPDLIVRLGPLGGPEDNDSAIDHRFSAKAGTMFGPLSYRFLKGRMSLSQVGQRPMLVGLDVGRMTGRMVPAILLNGLLAIALARNGAAMVHSGGVARDGSGILLAGPGGVGKTSLALTLLGRGLRYLGDDHVVLSGGRIYSFPVPVSVFSFNYVPFLKRCLSFDQKLRVLAYHWLHRLTAGLVWPPVPARIDNLGDQIVGASAPLRKAVMLTRIESDHGGSISIRRGKRKDLLIHLLAVQKLEMVGLTEYLEAHYYLCGGIPPEDFWRLYEENLEEAVPQDIVVETIEVAGALDAPRIAAVADMLDGRLTS